MRLSTCVLAVLLSTAFGCSNSQRSTSEERSSTTTVAGTLKLTSKAFTENGKIPRVHTCEGDDVSPPLAWTGVPPGAKSLALIVDDPDAPDPRAPRTIWVHWVLYDIPPTSTGLKAGAKALPPGTRQGRNDWKRVGYGGPCPPIGRHRYFHRLYALDRELPDLEEPTKAELVDAMKGHIIDQFELIGTYQKAGQ